MSHVGIRSLNATSGISAVFKNNVLLSRRYMSEKIIHRYVQLLIRFGEKKTTRWLTFLRHVAVVGGSPVARNQAIILMAVRENPPTSTNLARRELPGTGDAQLSFLSLSAGVGCGGQSSIVVQVRPGQKRKSIRNGEPRSPTEQRVWACREGELAGLSPQLPAAHRGLHSGRRPHPGCQGQWIALLAGGKA